MISSYCYISQAAVSCLQLKTRELISEIFFKKVVRVKINQNVSADLILLVQNLCCCGALIKMCLEAWLEAGGGASGSSAAVMF